MKNPDSDEPKYNLSDSGAFIIDNYNAAKPFSSFFPGIAGISGIPMWVFYLNRGQCISGMGVQDKDHSIVEFQPANRAYNLVSSEAFRTFLKLGDHFPISYYEPFQDNYRDEQLHRLQRMIIAPSQLTLEEVNHSLNLKFTVDYFTIPNDNYAGLARILRIQNLGSDKIDLEGLDGLPVIVPYGVDNFCLKNMRRTIEAFVEVRNIDNRVPFFKGKVEPADRPDVLKITKGNFYLGFESLGSDANIVDPIVDPDNIFGNHTDFSYPEKFIKRSSGEITRNQKLENHLPCALGAFRTSIPPDETFSYMSIIGHASSIEKLNAMIPRIARIDYIEQKARENRDLIGSLTQSNLICSNEPALDHYVQQNFLDNIMRGGYPVTLSDGEDPKTLHLYSRKHGDMERDYNDFSLTPTQYSQGNGNFRDINQNRRSDLFFNPDLGKENVEYFYNLIQLDGFNPLVLKELFFAVDDTGKLQSVLKKYIEDVHLQTVNTFVKKTFTPGELTTFLDEHDINPKVKPETFIGEVIGCCQKIPDTDYGESYWIDHWTYNLDLLENYQAVFPDKISNLLFNDITFSFYDNPNVVQPRDNKYVLWNGKPMQLGAVLLDKEKSKIIAKRKVNQNQVRIENGKGDRYFTTLFNKILCLLVNKLASLDPEGVGVEMEAGKPGWYDALNGLPGLFGSSICETLEIKRHILFLLDQINAFDGDNKTTAIFEELKDFMDQLNDLFALNLSPFEFWDSASTARENYREKTRLGISGKEVDVEFSEIKRFFEAALNIVNEGIEKGRDTKSNTIFTYFRYDLIEYEELEITDSRGNKKPKQNVDGLQCIRPVKFKQISLPLFLEGPVHYLRCLPGKDMAGKFATNIKQSALYDSSLRMYKVNASLADEPMEIGRARVFSPGWLENESIWLHMEYKYMLELLRNGLYDEFFNDFKNVCVPFMKPGVYGRSILENSSFLVSSAHPDSSIHGNGYVARLSGATAEFIHILLLMILGQKPFQLDKNKNLQFCLRPSLPGWIFSRNSRKIRIFEKNERNEIELPPNSFSFMLLGSILVTYLNDSLKDTFGDDIVRPIEYKIFDLEGNMKSFQADIIEKEIATEIRDRKVKKIEVLLG